MSRSQYGYGKNKTVQKKKTQLDKFSEKERFLIDIATKTAVSKGKLEALSYEYGICGHGVKYWYEYKDEKISIKIPITGQYMYENIYDDPKYSISVMFQGKEVFKAGENIIERKTILQKLADFNSYGLDVKYEPGEWEDELIKAYCGLERNQMTDIKSNLDIILKYYDEKYIIHKGISIFANKVLCDEKVVYDATKNIYIQGVWESEIRLLAHKVSLEIPKKILKQKRTEEKRTAEQMELSKKKYKIETSIDLLLNGLNVNNIILDGMNISRNDIDSLYTVSYDSDLVYRNKKNIQPRDFVYKTGLWEEKLELLFTRYAVLKGNLNVNKVKEAISSGYFEPIMEELLKEIGAYRIDYPSINQMAKEILMGLGSKYSKTIVEKYAIHNPAADDWDDNVYYKPFYQYDDYGLKIISEDETLDNIFITFEGKKINDDDIAGKDVLKALYDMMPTMYAYRELAMKNARHCSELYKRIKYLLKNNIIEEKLGEFERKVHTSIYEDRFVIGISDERNHETIVNMNKIFVNGDMVLQVNENEDSYEPIAYMPGLWEQKINELYDYHYGIEMAEKEKIKMQEEAKKRIQEQLEELKQQEKAKVYIKQLRNIK